LSAGFGTLLHGFGNRVPVSPSLLLVFWEHWWKLIVSHIAHHSLSVITEALWWYVLCPQAQQLGSVKQHLTLQYLILCMPTSGNIGSAYRSFAR